LINTINILIISCFSDAYDDSKESKKSRRQLCSNLFEHLFTQSTTEEPAPIINTPVMTSSTVVSNSNDIVKPPPPVVPKAQPVVPKLEFATIESFEQVNYLII
jgi:hypothetical protein